MVADVELASFCSDNPDIISRNAPGDATGNEGDCDSLAQGPGGVRQGSHPGPFFVSGPPLPARRVESNSSSARYPARTLTTEIPNVTYSSWGQPTRRKSGMATATVTRRRGTDMKVGECGTDGGVSANERSVSAVAGCAEAPPFCNAPVPLTGAARGVDEGAVKLKLGSGA